MNVSEQEWPRSDYPAPLLHSLCGKVSPRKMRLCGVTCCRRIAHLLPDDRCRRGIEVAERYADRTAKRQDLATAHADAGTAAREARAAADASGMTSRMSVVYAAEAVGWATHPTKRSYAGSAADCAAAAVAYAATASAILSMSSWERYLSAHADERAAQIRLLRDILRNPFRPVTLDPSWVTADVVSLARTAYDGRCFDHLPILADALEDAGCTDSEILNHCRQPGDHVRGCWVLDLLSGRT
jgi:hypothetical protein